MKETLTRPCVEASEPYHLTQQNKFHGSGKATPVPQVPQMEVGTHDTCQPAKRELNVELSFCSDDETLNTKERSVLKCPLQKKARRSEPKDPGTIRNGPCTNSIPVGLVFLLVWFYWVCHSGPFLFMQPNYTPQHRQTKIEGAGLPRFKPKFYLECCSKSGVSHSECLTKSVTPRVSS